MGPPDSANRWRPRATSTSIVAARYPYSDIRVKFPIDAEGFSSRLTLLE